MTPILEARRLADYIEALPDLQWKYFTHESYNHVGAILTDAGLQAGVNYQSVVAPRVNRILTIWPEDKTVSRFIYLINKLGVNHVLDWTHHEKPRRIYEMASLLLKHSIEHECEFTTWLKFNSNKMLLLQIHGIGPKTIDYLLKLLGQPSIAIDRHLITFASQVGIRNTSYEEMNRIYRFTADLLEVDYGTLDKTIWYYMSQSINDTQSYKNQMTLNYNSY